MLSDFKMIGFAHQLVGSANHHMCMVRRTEELWVNFKGYTHCSRSLVCGGFVSISIFFDGGNSSIFLPLILTIVAGVGLPPPLSPVIEFSLLCRVSKIQQFTKKLFNVILGNLTDEEIWVT